jgi:Arc/MetJ-type ribon-helix-helix transcriptional regulator
MEDRNTQNLAEKIARLLEENEKGNNDDFLRSSLEKINQRLDKIETRISTPSPKSQIPNPKSIHASQEKFTSLEELADEIIANLQNEKACPYEPTGKPCDHCAMCNSRGF